MADRTIIQWDKEDIESLGLLKVDILALGMLSAIRKSLQLVHRYCPAIRTVSDIPKEDAATYRMLQAGRHRRRVPDRVAGPDVHAAAAQARTASTTW